MSHQDNALSSLSALGCRLATTRQKIAQQTKNRQDKKDRAEQVIRDRERELNDLLADDVRRLFPFVLDKILERIDWCLEQPNDRNYFCELTAYDHASRAVRQTWLSDVVSQMNVEVSVWRFNDFIKMLQDFLASNDIFLAFQVCEYTNYAHIACYISWGDRDIWHHFDGIEFSNIDDVRKVAVSGLEMMSDEQVERLERAVHKRKSGASNAAHSLQKR